ncbi:MAG: hypothetical protein GF346_02560 [Candidatus Eisenbacteria bacterium]|nr:hypothetical protein [Candidatus Latescibacterota bacterium]MBD3301302.1 hypothetical protein [Candidatus Eisenbacteria bacterium]
MDDRRESKDRPALEQALREHHELIEIENRLGGLFIDNTCPAFQTWIRDVREGFGALRSRLGPHFELEEKGGLHQEILEALPNQAPRLERLIQEHASLLAQLDAIRDLSLRTERPPEDQELRRKASDFFAALDRHERAERELFLHAIEGDGGAPD